MYITNRATQEIYMRLRRYNVKTRMPNQANPTTHAAYPCPATIRPQATRRGKPEMARSRKVPQINNRWRATFLPDAHWPGENRHDETRNVPGIQARRKRESRPRGVFLADWGATPTSAARASAWSIRARRPIVSGWKGQSSRRRLLLRTGAQHDSRFHLCARSSFPDRTRARSPLRHAQLPPCHGLHASHIGPTARGRPLGIFCKVLRILPASDIIAASVRSRHQPWNTYLLGSIAARRLVIQHMPICTKDSSDRL